MTKIKLLCLLILSFSVIVCNAFSVKDIGDTISRLSSEFGISESKMQSDDSNVDNCPEKCSKEVAELKKNITELYMAFLALHAEFAHLSQHIILHEKALKHIAIMAHKRTDLNHNQTHGQDVRQNPEVSYKCSKCNKSSMNEDEDEDGDVRVHKHHNHHNHENHAKHDSHNHNSNSNDNETHKGDEQNDDKKQKRDDSKESSEEEEDSTTTISKVTVEPTSDPHNSHESDGNSSDSKIVSNPDRRMFLEHDLHKQMQIDSTDNDFKNWFDRMLNDIHKKSDHKNPIDVSVNDSDNSRSETDAQKTIEDKLQEMEKAMTSEELIFATCEVRPNRHIALLNQQEIRGRINMWQLKSNRGPLHMHIKLKGFKVSNHDHRPPVREVRETNLMPLEQEPDEPTQAQSHAQRVTATHTHGFHVHEYGNLTRDCQSVGAHYNPLNLAHGGPYDVIRHVGDLGNIRCNDNGETDVELTYSQVSLSGEHSIINRSLVIHNSADDYGRNPKNPASLTTGSSGIRIACCTIEEVKTLPKETDSQSKVGAVAASAPSNKRRREVSMRNHHQQFDLSELFQRFAKYENQHKYQSLFETNLRKQSKFSRNRKFA